MPDGLNLHYGGGSAFQLHRWVGFAEVKASARSLFVKELAQVRRERRFCLAGYVVQRGLVEIDAVFCDGEKRKTQEKKVQDPPSQTEGGAPSA
jgi:hypothetical protein